RLEPDQSLEMAHDGRAVLLLAARVGLVHLLLEEPFDLARRDVALGLRKAEAEIELREDRVVEDFPVVSLRGLLAAEVDLDEIAGEPVPHLDHVLAKLGFGQDLAAPGVNHLALLVEHVVVLEQVLADVEVVRLDLLLRVADRPRDETMLDRDALLHAELLHEVLHPIGAEDAQEIVLERQVEARRPGIALATGSTAQLVVDATRLVPFGSDDVETARLDHLLALARARLLILREDHLEAALVLLRSLLELLPQVLDHAHVVGALRLVALLGRTELLLVGPEDLVVTALGVVIRRLAARVGLFPGSDAVPARVGTD